MPASARPAARAGGSAEAGAAAAMDAMKASAPPPGGSAEAGAAARGVREDGEHFPGPAEAGAAATNGRDDGGERAPPGGSAEAGAGRSGIVAAMGVLDDGERSAMSRELVAKRRSESNRVTGTVGSRVASWASGVETRRWRAGTAAGEDIVAGMMIRPPLSCVKQSATSGTMPAPGDGGGAA